MNFLMGHGKSSQEIKNTRSASKEPLCEITPWAEVRPNWERTSRSLINTKWTPHCNHLEARCVLSDTIHWQRWGRKYLEQKSWNFGSRMPKMGPISNLENGSPRKYAYTKCCVVSHVTSYRVGLIKHCHIRKPLHVASGHWSDETNKFSATTSENLLHDIICWNPISPKSLV